MLTQAAYIMGTHAYFAREGDTVASVVATASVARASNVATIVTGEAHGLWTGAIVTLAGITTAGFNASSQTVTVVNATTFTYANSGSNVATTADTGGTVTLAGTCARLLKPGPNDSIWTNLGVIEDFSTNREKNDIKLYGPSPGKIVLTNVLTNKQELGCKMTCQEYSAIIHELLFLTEKLTSSSTQYNPLEGSEKFGWLKVQQYDQNDDIRNVVDLWGRLSISGDVQFGGSDVVKAQLEFLSLQSPLNTGVL